MKYLKLYENFNKIKGICEKYNVRNYTINQDETVDVDGDVYLSFKKLSKLPLNFGKVSGSFNCYDNDLGTLKGCPKEVGHNFNCHNTKLTSLEYGPVIVGHDFSCTCNNLTTLLNGPKIVRIGYYYFTRNNVKDMNGFPEIYTEGLGIFYTDNPIAEILDLVGYESRIKFIKYLNEYDVIRDGNKIVEMRLEEAYWISTKEELPWNKREFENYQLI